jgi:hypothetical protein
MSAFVAAPLWVAASFILFSIQFCVVSFNVVAIIALLGLAQALRLLRLTLRLLTWPVPSQWAKSKRVQTFRRTMREATSFDDWLAAASEVDKLENATAWRWEQSSTEYNSTLVEETTKRLRDARRASDIRTLQFILRTVIQRQYAGIDRASLYRRAHTGTKIIIEAFQAEVNRSLAAVAASTGVLSPQEKLEFFEHCRLQVGRTALALSGGGALAMSHMGVVKCLIERGLLPRVISGASGGSIIAGMMAFLTDEELLAEALQPGIVDRFGVTFFDPLPQQIYRFMESALRLGAPRLMESDRFSAAVQVSLRVIVCVCINARYATLLISF